MGSGAIKNPGFDLPVLDAIFLSGSRVMVDGFETLRVLQRHGPISLRHKEGCNKDTRKVATKTQGRLQQTRLGWPYRRNLIASPGDHVGDNYSVESKI